MSKKILGLDLGSNSIGWALIGVADSRPEEIIGIGERIFPKAVEDKTPTPKNMKRRMKRLGRRVLQRRARRKQRMLHYLIKLDLLPATLKTDPQPEITLNDLGDPYELRARALDNRLEKYQLGRVFLHLVQRRGFLSNRKTLLGDMVDDPDVMSVLDEENEGEIINIDFDSAEETAFKKDITQLRKQIQESGCRTLGEYLSQLNKHEVKRNRAREGGHLRTDRQMYQEEFTAICEKQGQHHEILNDDVIAELWRIIFFQRPLKLRPDRVGRCSLEKNRKRCRIARLEYQQFRYLQDINNLQFFDDYQDRWNALDDEQKAKLVDLFERHPNISFPRIRKTLGLDKKTEFNLEHGNKKLKGNITACEIRGIISDWDEYSDEKQHALVEDLVTTEKKSVLKSRLVNHWGFSTEDAIRLCLLEFEPDYGHVSLKAINKLLPFLGQGQIYSEARKNAGYGYELEDVKVVDRLSAPPEIPNPIVQKALHELRRVVNALISEYGKPDAIRIEMARDLEMNTKRYREYIQRQKKNTKANDDAVDEFQSVARKNPHLGLSKYPARNDKIKYRLWKDQDGRCVYSGESISIATLFSAEVDIDHIIPYSQSLDDSYMNKVICYAGENRYKGQRTPIDAYGNSDKWDQITRRIARWDKGLSSKKNRFYMTDADITERDFINSQLNDTRYISKIALEYVKQLGCDVSVSKGITTAWLRHQWDLNRHLGKTSEKERTDHRHHAIDALVVACVDRGFYQRLARVAREHEKSHPELSIKDLTVDPPWPSISTDLEQGLQENIVSHASIKGLVGAFHEETGVGFIEGLGTVYRQNLDRDFKQSWVKDIVDEAVRDIVAGHLEKYGNDPKKAFAEDITVYHKDGKTPIKRVRVVQSKSTLKKLERSKYGVRNKNGQVFKWLTYGNNHHVEIIRNKNTGKYTGVFVNMHEAARRARGVNGTKMPTVTTDHGDDMEFIMALHINDMVSVDLNGTRQFYRVQKLEEDSSRIALRLNTAATINNKSEELRKSISGLMAMDMQLHKVNAIGKIIS